MLTPVLSGRPVTELDEVRTTEFARLDEQGHVYLDYTGAALYPASLVRAHADELVGSILGNPHSVNPSSARSSAAIEHARHAVLEFLRADPQEYQVIFTFNASAAIKLVGESFPFAPGSRFLLTRDNHNSVNGVREYARRAGAEVVYLPLDEGLGLEPVAFAPASAPSLFAYPAQSNFSGIRHDLSLVRKARAAGYRVLLDAAAYVPGNRLDLGAVEADFVALSFYKIFGYPTGIGALVARREALAELRRPWFAGGTVAFAATRPLRHQLLDGEDAFEDGTPSFAVASAVTAGLAFMESVGMGAVHAHVAALTAELDDRLAVLAHGNGAPLIRRYGGPGQRYGGARAINVLDQCGEPVPYEQIEAAAGRASISIRGGCFCNPGCAEAAFSFPEEAQASCLERLASGFSPQRFARCMGVAAAGAVRVSLGLANTRADLDRLLVFLQGYRRAAGDGRPVATARHP